LKSAAPYLCRLGNISRKNSQPLKTGRLYPARRGLVSIWRPAGTSQAVPHGRVRVATRIENREICTS
jgi:hypothetical protein